MEEDARDVELSTLAAIYPELRTDDHAPYTVSIDLPVSLETPLTVLFPAATESAPPVAPSQATVPTVVADAAESQALSHLPSLHVRIALPDGYPETKPPEVSISTTPLWLPENILRKLEGNARTLWEGIGRDQVIFYYLDDLQQSAENVFGLVGSQGTLEVAPEHKIAILDYDIKAKRKAFEKETFDCGICLDPKKGLVCHRMLDCGHVFCVQCLQDFYNNAITEGDVSSVQCLEPHCAKEREDAARKASTKRRKPKTFISPSELLQIPIETDLVKRYVMMKHKTELESDKNTVYCPRPWCQGAARSKKHRKPEGLELIEASDDESEGEEEPSAPPADGKPDKAKDADLLAICEDCGFAFCTRCAQSWHGEFKYCISKQRKQEVTEEEKLTLEYLEMYTTPCPTCAAPCQKTHGCNHMRCFRCQTHFCYLCSAWLDPSNPYQHFNVQPSGKVNSCYMRLWELEGGDGAGVGIAYEGNANVAAERYGGNYGEHLEILDRPREVPAAAAAAGAINGNHDDMNIEPPVNVNPEGVGAGAAREVPAVGGPQIERADGQINGRVGVAREGPLVLRIEGNAVPAGGRGADHRRPDHAVQAVNEAQPQRGVRGNRRGRGGAPGVNRQNHRNRPHQAPNQRENRGGRQVGNNGGPLRGENQLDPGQAEWVRNFVQLALNDQEHLVDDAWDSDDE
ncbi:RWD domain-containing protein [Xylariomycetidae sp. FL2044]|nr:RWD domain-containing protein [Xylariomycetidae sp. FL2044]